MDNVTLVRNILKNNAKFLGARGNDYDADGKFWCIINNLLVKIYTQGIDDDNPNLYFQIVGKLEDWYRVNYDSSKDVITINDVKLQGRLMVSTSSILVVRAFIKKHFSLLNWGTFVELQ